MGAYATQRARTFYAQTYDTVVGDWAGETDFYQSFSRFKVELALEDEGWRIVDGDRYFTRGNWTSNYCK